MPEYIAHLSSTMAKNASPGPAAYTTTREFACRTAPVKIRNRYIKNEQPPRPAYVNLPTCIGQGPKCHMGHRCESKQGFVTPGPSYIPPAFGSQGKKVGIAPPSSSKLHIGKDGKTARRRNRDETPGPGPGKYSTRTEDFNTSKNIKGKIPYKAHNFNYDLAATPGPAAYKPHYEKVLPSSEQYTIKHRPQTADPKPTPGYRALASTLGGPKFTIKRREDDTINIV